MWFTSKYYTDILGMQEDMQEDMHLIDCFTDTHHNISHLNDFIALNVTKENNINLFELADFLMVEDIDPLVDKIIECMGYSVIHTFGNQYRYNSGRLKPLTKEILYKAIKLYCEDEDKCYKTYGYSAYWDVSNVTNMNSMFCDSPFNGDISQWNVSNVTDMSHMFSESQFNGDISHWNVSNVTDMSYMFCGGGSYFNGDISKWNVSNVINMNYMYYYSPFNGDISQWNVSKVEYMDTMFYKSQFNGDISHWNVSNVKYTIGMFCGSKFNGDISKWNVSTGTSS